MNISHHPSNSTSAFATLLGIFALMGGLVSFLGWVLDVPRLADWFNDGISIQPNACVLMTLSGAALLVAQWRWWKFTMVVGSLVGLGGLLILLQYIVGVDFGFNHVLTFGRSWGQGSTVSPGRVGPPACISFALIGLALMLLAWAGLNPPGTRWRSIVPKLGLTVGLIVAFSLLGYLFDAKRFYSIPWLTAIALQTSMMLLTLGMGLILSVPEHHPLLLLRERSGAGALARIALPTLLMMIPALLWLRVKGYELGYYDLGTSRALGALSLVIGTFSLVWIALTALRNHEEKLQRTIAELEEADRRKDEFLATLAHELRNPLAPVMNGLAILDRVSNDDALAIEARATMWRQMKHMVRLIDDLLDVSRISRGTIQLRKESAELRSIIEQTVESIRPVCEAAEQRLHVQLPFQAVWVMADPVRLAQIVGNLLSNASRYSGPGSDITLNVTAASNEVVIRVQDQGIGIPPEKLEHIFEMFSQLDQSLDRPSEGLGIGLYLVKRLVHMHDGTVKAHSAGPRCGSEFVVRLPIVVAGPVNQTPQMISGNQHAASTAAAQRVLIVDDNVDAAKSLAMLLSGYGYLTHSVHDGHEALTEAQRFQPAIVLLDIGLPTLDGFEVCQQIRAQTWGSEMHVIAITGWGQESHRQQAEASGFHAHLVKPVDPDDLLLLLRSLPDESLLAEEGQSENHHSPVPR